MSLLNTLFGTKPSITAMQLDVLMSYDIRQGAGRAALRSADPYGGGPSIQAQLVALLYGRILCVHRETRKELFGRVNEWAAELIRSQGRQSGRFRPWSLEVDGRSHALWPWELVEEDRLSNPKIYSAKLVLPATNVTPASRSLHLDMAFGLERVLAPSSALIAIDFFSRRCDEDTRYFLAVMLSLMNSFWGSPERVTVGSEMSAYFTAELAILKSRT